MKEHLPFNFEWTGENIDAMYIKYNQNEIEYQIPDFYENDTYPSMYLTIMHNYNEFIWEKDIKLKTIIDYFKKNNIKSHYSCGISDCIFELYRLNNYQEKTKEINEILNDMINDNNKLYNYHYFIHSDPDTEVYKLNVNSANKKKKYYPRAFN